MESYILSVMHIQFAPHVGKKSELVPGGVTVASMYVYIYMAYMYAV